MKIYFYFHFTDLTDLRFARSQYCRFCEFISNSAWKEFCGLLKSRTLKMRVIKLRRCFCRIIVV
ncbi:unnamed protein product [Moneuplotes crassus]|uniref:Uncharacterized protein n=1 Tax=Euplotes crassus TaxID=5936 RepID=A0AAD1XCU6_EUPCR|nr:unnamed protein product [Moneuplotes crassus]